LRSPIQYPYSEGNKLENKNTYFYTSYSGKPFLDAWKSDRSKAIAGMESALVIPAPEPVAENDFSGYGVLERILKQIESSEESRMLLLLIKRFEVTKRIYLRYKPDLRPVDSSEFRDLSLYLRWAEILGLAYEKFGHLFYLNAFIKVLDTLISVREDILAEGHGRFARCIMLEVKVVENLMNKVTQ
jgi:hypothetical protein